MKKKFTLLRDKELRKNLKKLKKLILSSKKILVTGHINTDGDNISSQLALGRYLKDIGKDFDIMWSEKVPENFDFLPDLDVIKYFDENSSLAQYDTVIVVDSGDLKRVGKLSGYLENKFILH